MLVDAGSKNGVVVGSKESYRTAGNRIQRHELTDGDHILMGNTTLVFKKV